MCLSNTCLHVTGATLGCAHGNKDVLTVSCGAQGDTGTSTSTQHPAVNSCGSIMEKKNGDVRRNGRLAGMNM